MSIFLIILLAVAVIAALASALIPGVRVYILSFFEETIESVIGGFEKVDSRLDALIEQESTKRDNAVTVIETAKEEARVAESKVERAVRVQAKVQEFTK